MEKQYTKETLIKLLQNVAKKEGLPVTMPKFKKQYSKPSVTTFIYQFGSWMEAVRQAGLEHDTSHRIRYSKEEIIGKLQILYELNGKVSRVDYEKSGFEPHYTSIFRIFGSWENALREAGIPSNQSEISKKEVIDSIQTFYHRFHSINQVDYKNSGCKPSLLIIKKVFGSWENALKEAGISFEMKIKYSNDELLDMLRDFAMNNKFNMSTKHFDSLNYPVDSNFFRNRFGSWKKALERINCFYDSVGKIIIWFGKEYIFHKNEWRETDKS